MNQKIYFSVFSIAIALIALVPNLDQASGGMIGALSSSHPTFHIPTLGTETTLAGCQCKFHVNWSTSLGALDQYTFGTNASGTGWQNVTYSFSGGSWSNQTRVLPAEHGVRVEWQVWANNTEGNWNTTGLQALYTTWNSSKTISWIMDKTIERMVNTSFPLAKEWDERTNQATGLCDAELLVGVLAYKLVRNETYLDYAEEYADWLSGQPVCRLFQIYNLTSENWKADVNQAHSGIMLTLLAQLALYNSSYELLLQRALKNFTDIFVPQATSRGFDIRFVNGSTFYNVWGMPLEQTSIQAFAYSIAGVAYSGHVLSNDTWIQRGIDMVLNYTLGAAGVPYHQINQAGSWWGGVLSKEDATIGMYLLAAETVYALTENETVKERIRTVSESTIEHAWVEDRELFRYQTNPDTGNPPLGGGKLSVHGFGALDEALLQASLIWGNHTWISCAATDYITMVADGRILINNLVCHAVSWNSTSYWIDSSIHYDSDVYWNSFSIRAGLLFYAANVTGIYHNKTFLEGYKKLYDAQNAHHKAAKGFVRGLNVTDFNLVSPSYPNYLPSYDNHTPIYVSRKCFAPAYPENLVINSIIDIYTRIGSPLTGVAMRPWNAPPSKPTINVTPDNPITTEALTCTITIPSIDSDGDAVEYIYEWFRDQGSGFEPVPALTTFTTELNLSIDSLNTQKDEAWKCVVTSHDGAYNSTSDEDQVTILNSPPTIDSHYPPSHPTIQEGQSQEFNITKSDLDEEPLSVKWWLNGSMTNENTDYYMFIADYWSSGTYNVSVSVSDDSTNTTLGWWLEVVDVVRDASIFGLAPCKTAVGHGYPAYLNITIENQGELTETFNVTVYANSTTIIAYSEVFLASYASSTITITLNTATFSMGSYTISALVSPVQGETDLADNSFDDGWFVVTIPGDADADFDVDIYDIVIIADAYDTQRGDSRFAVNGDIDGDWDIDIYDVVIAADNYGESWPP